MTIGTLALIILAAILAQIAVVVLFGLYRRKSQYLDLVKRSSEAQINSQDINPVGCKPSTTNNA